ncbi:receptor-like protein kinase FERONIA [Fagus crenata]
MKNPKTKKASARKLYDLTPLHLFFFFFILRQLAISLASDLPPAPYSPTINIALNCGSSGVTSAGDNRTWLGDIKSDFGPFQHQNNSSVNSTAARQPLQVDKVPYYTARLSHSEFTYKFSVTPGQLFIRLHFLPASYQNFDRSNTLSVKAGLYTLLSNFSAALTADALQLEGFSREFCINIVEDDQLLNITFIPSPGNPDAYAFVNGIEIVSMPSNLYYTAPESTGVKFIGQIHPYRIEEYNALETIYRINVAGRFISPSEDTGMYRSWSNNDFDYLTDSEEGVNPVNTTIHLRFSTETPEYTAPEDVYTTARTMGTNKTQNKSYNLTWEFPVDASFNYLVRLHFCEFQPEVMEEQDRVFYIFIADQTAEVHADVIMWSGGHGIPTYRDYAVSMFGNKGNEKRLNLSVALQSNPDDWKTLYSDAILNGLEIFKINDSTGNLAGPNPDSIPIRKVPISPIQPRKVKLNHRTIIGIIVGLFSGIALLSLLGFFIFQRGRRVKTMKNQSSSYLPSDLCRYFSLSEIKAATNNFDSLFIIGVGGFGDVYKGYIDGEQTPVAIKRLSPGSKQGAHEFKTEIEMLSQLRHLHLVSLIGYCNDGMEMILVYDYMAHGTLRDHLYNTDHPPLSWEHRLQICIGAALLCARPPLIRNAEKEKVSLAEWARKCYHRGKLDQIVDPFLKGKIVPECLNKFGEIVVNCMLDVGIERPSMNDVVWGLEFALQLQESNSKEQTFEIKEDEKALLRSSAIIDDCDKVFTSSTAGVEIGSSGEQSFANEVSNGSNVTCGTVFSELISQKGR